MAFSLTFSTDNAAFEDYGRGHEVARILTAVASAAGDGLTHGTVRDVNGGTVGTWSLD